MGGGLLTLEGEEGDLRKVSKCFGPFQDSYTGLYIRCQENWDFKA